MCSQPDTLSLIANTTELVNDILVHLNSDDTETLIQVLRVLQAALWDIKRDKNSKWQENLTKCEFLGERLIFILQYSANGNCFICLFYFEDFLLIIIISFYR